MLVLNATYEPLSVVSVARALHLVMAQRAEVLETADAVLRSAQQVIPVPLVIRLLYYVRVPHNLPLPLSRKALLLRDNYTCQYCGAQPPRDQLTIDHVLPRSRGGHAGGKTW